MAQNPQFYWVALNLVKGIGAIRMRLLLKAFGSAETVWNASLATLEHSGLYPRLAQNLVETRQSGVAERTWDSIQQQHITVLTWDDPGYPRRLKEIEAPPPVLYVRGTIEPGDDFAAAIVGTRRATAYGRQVAEELGRELSQAGMTIVSGLARGIDAAAHMSALRAGGRTLAVLGSGVDNIYPPEHRQMAAQIVEHGAVLSDYPPGTAPEASNFPPRNRIISGLSQAVVVVEAGEKSGALITASFAADQGRDVFAVPGSMYAPQSRGANRLIQDGAQLLLSAKDILAQLNLFHSASQQHTRQVLPADPMEARLLTLLRQETLHVDELRLLADLPVEQVSAALTIMELKGLVRNMGSARYMAAEAHAGYYSQSMEAADQDA